jgi:hypothetical protein
MRADAGHSKTRSTPGNIQINAITGRNPKA